MWWQYLLVFVGAVFVDIVPFPLPPAFTVMIVLQVVYDLEIWKVVAIGVLGSIFGRSVLILYISLVSNRLFKPDKNEDSQYLGTVMKRKGWKGKGFIFLYSLLPLPTTPLFVAAGMAQIKPWFIIPAFIVGKVISDTAAVMMGNYTAKNAGELIQGMISLKSLAGLIFGLLLLIGLLFIDWRTLLRQKKFMFKFNVWKK